MPGYKVLIKPSAVKEIDSVSTKQERRRIVSRIGRLAENPRPAGCEKLSGQEKCRVRHGRYRIVYSIDDREMVVLVVKIGNRREIRNPGKGLVL